MRRLGKRDVERVHARMIRLLRLHGPTFTLEEPVNGIVYRFVAKRGNVDARTLREVRKRR